MIPGRLLQQLDNFCSLHAWLDNISILFYRCDVSFASHYDYGKEEDQNETLHDSLQSPK